MNINWRAIRTLIAKDWRVITRSKIILLPMIILPVILLVVLPAGLGLAAGLAPAEFTGDSDLSSMLEAVPPAVDQQLSGLNQSAYIAAIMLVYLFAPMFLIVPMMVSSVVAADSFVGEKERKTLEALLHAPLSDLELLLAKMLGAWLAALAVSIFSFILYIITVDIIIWTLGQTIVLPNLMWMILVFWVGPGAAAIGLGATVLLSARVKTFQEAYQAGGVVIVPILGVMFAQLAGAIFLSPVIALLLGAASWLIAGALLWFGKATFRRERLLTGL